jgi:cyclohexyl-isocyanide hydratase
MKITRRKLITGAVGLSAVGAAAVAVKEQLPSVDEATRMAKAHDALMKLPDLKLYGDEKIAMLLYPGFTALDMVGPNYFLASMMGAKVHLVAATLDPVKTDLGYALVPDTTFADCPEALDVLFVPGGATGTLAAARHAPTLDFVRARAAKARYISSVCTGSLILGAAGLLTGKRATSHWLVREELAGFGAIPVDERVVVDGNLYTGAGVSAGLDLGLTLLGELRGAAYAEAMQLQAEYAPKPPYDAGTPERSRPEVLEGLRMMYANFIHETRALAVAVRA